MEESRRMVDLMLGRPSTYFTQQPFSTFGMQLHHDHEQQHPTLDLLHNGAAARPSSLRHASSSSPLIPLSLLDSTHLELEPDSPLPSGWEKCLDLKTGSIYYLHRRFGTTSSAHPGIPARISQGHSQIRTDLNSWPPPSPTSSELTVEATHVEACHSYAKKQEDALNKNVKPQWEAAQAGEAYGEDGDLDLKLSLHVGSYAPAKSTLNPITPSQIRASSNLLPASSSSPPSYSYSSSSSSSSSSTSSPIISSLSFSPSINPSKEPSISQSCHDAIFKQDNNQSRSAVKSDRAHQHPTHPDYSFDALDDQRLQLPMTNHAQNSSSTSMVTVACANCLMFVMLCRSNPKCPKCGSCPNQLDFPHPPPIKKAKLGFCPI